ncbi:hypothetical protein BCV70DRAFT_224893 [Testicularia cyperi]|uniref:Histone H4 n=1 Tax=Testicularia cyperi TaxID=1882483 RepID=A0A317XYU5_9BASI|nr:hypothetical protein BCV70DRAFT_224893 [Testicularia cyperi]
MSQSTEAITLLPLPLELAPPTELGSGSTAQGAHPTQATVNLMPFSIEYDGPAPIDSFMVIRPAPSTQSSKDADSQPHSSNEQSYVSAFRGRAIQSTSLPLPTGYRVEIVEISQSASNPVEASASKNPAQNGMELSAAVRPAEQQTPLKKRPSSIHRPAKQQKFSMDSDDEDQEEAHTDAEDGQEQEPRRPESPDAPVASSRDAQSEQAPSPASAAHRGGITTVIRPVASAANNEIRIWGADGPIDRGDDTYFKTVQEWLGVVSPLCIPRAGYALKAHKRHLNRHMPPRKTALEMISKNEIRRLARRGGVTRIAGGSYEEFRFILRDFLAIAVRDAIIYATHCNRKTVQTMDVIYSLKKQGRTLYYF